MLLKSIQHVWLNIYIYLSIYIKRKMKSETGACYACMFLLRWTPCWPVFGSVLQRAGLVWLRVRGPERGKGGRVWRSQLQNVDAGTKRSRKNKRGVQLSPTHALRLQTLKKKRAKQKCKCAQMSETLSPYSVKHQQETDPSISWCLEPWTVFFLWTKASIS